MMIMGTKVSMGGIVQVWGGSEEMGIASMIMGFVADGDDEPVHGFLGGKATARTSQNSLLEMVALFIIDGNGSKGIDLNNVSYSSSSSDFGSVYCLFNDVVIELGHLFVQELVIVILHTYYVICLIYSSLVVRQAMGKPLCPKFCRLERKKMEWCEIVSEQC
jgi:hypothetical protein